MTNDSKDNADVKQHLLNIEARLDRLSISPNFGFDVLSARRDDEIDLRKILNALWDGKWWIICVTFLFAIGSAVFALSLPNQYKAEIILAPAQEQNGGMGGLAAQYGGLAAMAGINLGGGQSSDIDQAIVLLTSRPFLNAFIEKYDLKPEIMAIKGWDSIKDRILYDKDIYNPDSNEWLREPKPNRPAEPTNYEVYEVFSKMLGVNHDVETGFIRVNVEHYVPKLAYDWVGLLTQELNRHFQSRDISDATRNIEYLRGKINETGIAEMQSVFYRMIESQMKTLMLAEVSGEYLVKSVVAASLPEIKSKPNRVLICLLGVVLGGMLSVILIFVFHFFRDDDASVSSR